MPIRGQFDFLAVIDFSAASAPGPARPSENQIWAAFEMGGERSGPTYFRTRFALLEALEHFLRPYDGSALLAWDFAFGYPAGSGLGGGRGVARRLHDLIEDGDDNRNNRFDVAEALNDRLGAAPGPFWACPPQRVSDRLAMTKAKPWPFGFDELRTAERVAHEDGFQGVQSVWKLYTPGSVGSQTLMGLATTERLNRRFPDRSVRYWPLDTGWDRALDGIVHVECWPGLFAFDHVDHPIRDARQVSATLDVIVAANREGGLSDLLGAPDLPSEPLAAVEREEGWILGLRTGRQRA